jgi:23S rRNA pseudouridine1911/1915/1917 synthase
LIHDAEVRGRVLAGTNAVPLDILYEDAHLLAVSKPAGLSTQAPPIAGDTLERQVRAYLAADDPAGAYVGTLHRLDRPVSGVVLWAKSSRDARRVARQFERRQTRKEYWALLEQAPVPAEGIWVDWLAREDTGLGRVQVVSRGTPRAQEAITRYEVIERADAGSGLAWVRLLPETGRMHQLRVQASARGCPIAGDATYGATRGFPTGIALHARSLTVRHPILEQPLTLVAPVPAAWLEAGFTGPPDAPLRRT